MNLFLLLLFIGAELVHGNPSCPKSKEGFLNVHLVCHTHDDVGWLKTVDQYYYGANTTIQRAGVQYILDTVVGELLKNPDRKFIYVESAFFFRWWDEQSDQIKSIVKSLVKRGQLEFINGGWCMNDEAAAHYNAIIDQMTLGMALLNDTFGEEGRPRIAWQIDPFGHSREQASLFAQMGFDGLFFGRLDFADKEKRWNNKTMEMVWQGSEYLGEDAWLFTGALPNGYDPPHSFCYDSVCADPPIMDDPKLHDYNVQERVDAFIKAAQNEAKGYATNDIIMTMGSDFQYSNALLWFKNLDKLIKYVNERQEKGSKVNVFYSTPSCYLDSLHTSKNQWTTKNDDFFPYASDHHAYWTGYFTSRPALKGYVRSTNNILQGVKQLMSLTSQKPSIELEVLKKAMGVAQHHDAVSGTAKQHVTDDYNLRLYNGISNGVKSINTALNIIQPSLKGEGEFQFCPYLNISSCNPIENSKSFQITVYNPLSRERSHYIRVPVVENTAYKVTGPDGTNFLTQLVDIPEPVFQIPGRFSQAKYELVFYEPSLPPLGYKTYLISNTSSKKWNYSRNSLKSTCDSENNVLTCGKFEISLDKNTGKLKQIKFDGKEEINLQQDWSWYRGMNGNNSNENNRASGAYIFRPNGSDVYSISDKVQSVMHQGDIVCEIQQKWSSWMSQVIRVHKISREVEIEWLVGPIPINDKIGKEVIHRITIADMKTDNTFYTDANGREILKRVKNFRPTWNLTVTEPVAGNYYPVNSRIILKATDKDTQVVVLNDRSQGGSSLNEGQLELMVHRRLLHDDAFGVGEPLNETAYGKGLVVRGKHYLAQSNMMTNECDFECFHITRSKELMLQPLYFFKKSVSSRKSWLKRKNIKWSGIQSLPENVHLLTLEPWKEGQLLLRLEHMYPNGDSVKNKPVAIDLQKIFKQFKVTAFRETTLAANQWKDQSHRYSWNVKTQKNKPKRLFHKDPFTIVLKPMEIKSFIININ